MKIKMACHYLSLLFTALLISGTGHTTNISTYPERTVSIIAPIAAGGLTDTIARLIATELSEELNETVIVENKPGGGGIVGMQSVAKAKPDGYTLILAYQGAAVVNPLLYDDLPYDTERDFEPIAGIGTFPMVLVTNSQTSFENVQNLIEYATSDPGRLSYGSAGNATTSHLTMELFKNATDADILHIPYKGEGEANTDLASQHVDLAFSSLASVLPLIKDGRVTPLGVATLEPSPQLPGVPPISETLPAFEAIGWYGLLAPAGTSPEITQFLSDSVASILAKPNVRKKLQDLAFTAEPMPSEKFQQHLSNETTKWREVIQKADIRID